MIFDMLKRLRSVVYLPNDYVCKKVSCVGSVPAGPSGVCSPSTAAMMYRGPRHCQVFPKLSSHRGARLAEKGWWGPKLLLGSQSCHQEEWVKGQATLTAASGEPWFVYSPEAFCEFL